MLLADYEPLSDWAARIQPYGPLALDPASAALHYGQTVFEGLKAFRGDDGVVRMFRPQRHLERLVRSGQRLCMQAPQPDEALAWLLQLLRLERDWVPSGAGTSLYIRPVIMASEAFLGVRASRSYTFFVILSPVGRYYESQAPMRLLVEDRYVRAVGGGVGAAKTGGNYAAALLAAAEAQAAGYDQVLWLDG